MAYVPPHAGDLRHSVRIERRSAASDDMGNEVSTWATVATVPARLAPARGGEAVQAARLAGLSTYDVTVRSSTVTRAITTADRLVDVRTGQAFNVRWIANLDERDRFVVLTCEAGGAAG